MTTARDCILYARFSSDRQNPKSCVDQLREAGRYASAHGWRVVGQYQDAAVSGTKGRADRAGWDELLEFIERGGLRAGGIVLTWDIDRWSRDWADGMIEALRLHKLGVSLADTKDGVLEQAGLAGKILLTLKVAGSAEFIDKLRRGVVRGLDAKRAAGYWTQTPPFGYSAMTGSFRARSGKQGRGLGLPKIYRSGRVPMIKNLVVLSLNAGVNCSTNHAFSMSNTFQGTLITWDIS